MLTILLLVVISLLMDVYKSEASTNRYYFNRPGYFDIHLLSGINDKKVLTVYSSTGIVHSHSFSQYNC